MIVKIDEKFALGNEFGAPFVAVEFHDFLKIFGREIFQAIGIEVIEIGDPADLGFVASCAAGAAFHDPFEDPHVVSEAGPHEFSFLGFAEPIDVEEAGEVGEVTLHF